MASFSIFRLFRFLRTIFAPTAAVIGFSCLLTFIFILYQPNAGPGELQRVGWQAWEVVSLPPRGSTVNGQETASTPLNNNTNSSISDVDWWNVTIPQDNNVDAASLPLDIWSPLLPHDTGLSEITVTRCMFYPGLADLCSPSTTIEQDAIKGKWVRVDRNLNSQSGIWQLNIYYRRTRRLDIPLITELCVLPQGEEPTTMSDAWHKVPLSLRDGVPRTSSVFLWYRTGKTAREMSAQEKQSDVVTELDILYGEDRPWYGFEKLYPPTTEEKEGRVEAAWITYRRGVKHPPKAPPLHFSRDGNFKVLQIADLHFSVSRGVCRDTVLNPCVHSDNLTETLLGHVLDEEKPSLVVFTGDQLNGQGTSWDPKSVLAKFATAVTDRGIPWAAVFGNHDSENGLNRDGQIRLLQALPYSLVQAGPKDVNGVGNYVLKVMSADASKTHLLTLYFLDSGSYSKGFFDFWGFFTPTEYDWIHENQINWFLQESASINPIERPFRPDTGKDLGDMWARQDQVTPEPSRLAKPNALMFFHIPLQETYSRADVDTRSGAALDVGLRGLETKGPAKHNDGFFEKGLLKATATAHRSGKNELEVKVVGNGHCHVTENCRRVKGVWLCFGGGGSYSGYGKVGFDRRFRIYDISNYGETIVTYKRTEKDLIIDRMILAGPGSAPPYVG